MKKLNITTLFKCQAHIGHLKKYRHPKIKPFLFGTYNNLDIINLDITIKQLVIAKQIIQHFNIEDILIISSIEDLSNISKWKAGTLTNLKSKHYCCPKILVVDSIKKNQIAVTEALKMNIPIIGICDTNVSIENIDYPIIMNDDNNNAKITVLKFLLDK